MKSFSLSVLMLLLLFDSLTSQESAADSQKTYPLTEVVVTATRSPISRKDSPVQVDVIDHDALLRVNGSTAADALGQASAVFMKDYGANGALKTLSLRGGASEHVLVLVNGFRVNSFQNGLADLSLVPLNDVERIEVLHGGGSALYGADALGGVVNIITRDPGSELRLRAAVTGGSFGFGAHAVEGQVRFGSLGLLGGYASDRGRDDYLFHFSPPGSGDTSTTRSDADFFRRQMYLHASLVPDARTAVKLSLQYVLDDRGAPGPFDPSFPGVARQNDEDANASVSFNSATADEFEWSVRYGFHYNLENYDDPNPVYPYRTFYKNFFSNLNPELRLRLSESQTVTVGGEFGQGTLDSPDFDAQITRVQKAAYASSESRFEFNRELFDRLSLYQTVRYDRISDGDAALTPKFGMNLRVSRRADLRVRASIGGNFRSPSFNDLYFRGFSNPNLKAEHSTGFDAGVSTSFAFLGQNTLEYTYFHIDTDDRILFDPTTFTPVNIGKVLSQGSEVKYTGLFFDRLLTIAASYSFTDARKRNLDAPGDPTFDKQLVYIPVDILNITAGVHWDIFSLNIIRSITGSRYITTDNSQALASFRVTGANAALDVPVGGRRIYARTEVNNLFDESYEVFRQYPMAGRNYRVTFGVGY